MKVKCIKEFHSLVFPKVNFGVLGKEYTVVDKVLGTDGSVKYLSLEGIRTIYSSSGIRYGWVNAYRFQEVRS